MAQCGRGAKIVIGLPFGCMKARRVFLIACCLAILSVNAVLGQTVDKKRLKDISFDDIKFDIKSSPTIQATSKRTKVQLDALRQ